MSPTKETAFLPAAFLEKMKVLLKDEYEDYLKCFESPRIFGLRVNTAKISVRRFLEIAPWPLTAIPWIENGFYYDGSLYSPAKHPYYFAGLYYLQEPSAMTPANRLPVKKGESVLDLCAAPGGKTTELGAKLAGEGLLVANDISSSRAKGLLKNIELFGIGNCIITCEEPQILAKRFPRRFDKILIDAPCSGEGMFRKEHRMAKAWLEHGPSFFSPIQKNILKSTLKMLKPGGTILYSTCTFDPSENEELLFSVMSEFPGLTPVAMEDYTGFTASEKLFPSGMGLSTFNLPQERIKQGLSAFRRLFPHRLSGEGHFAALLKYDETKSGSEYAENHASAKLSPDSYALSKKNGGRRRRSASLPDELADFLSLIDFPFSEENFIFMKNTVYYVPDTSVDLSGIRTMRAGLLFGELKKNRFEPSQALAMWLKKDMYRNIISLSRDDERVIRYLKGETLSVTDLTGETKKGWYLVCVDGFPLGFGKLQNGILKNKYLPGWRWAG